MKTAKQMRAIHNMKSSISELNPELKRKLAKNKNNHLALEIVNDLKKRISKGEDFQFSYTYDHGRVSGCKLSFSKRVFFGLEMNKRFRTIELFREYSNGHKIWASIQPHLLQAEGISIKYLRDIQKVA